MIVVHHAKPNRLQSKALLLAEKVLPFHTHTHAHTHMHPCMNILSYSKDMPLFPPLSQQIGVLAEHNEELMKLKHAGPWSELPPLVATNGDSAYVAATIDHFCGWILCTCFLLLPALHLQPSCDSLVYPVVKQSCEHNHFEPSSDFRL